MTKTRIAVLAALVAATSLHAEPTPLEQAATNAAFCLGWSDMQSRLRQGLTTTDQIILPGHEDGEVTDIINNLRTAELTVYRNALHCRALPSRVRVMYPRDFVLPHADVYWTTGEQDHIRILLYLSRDKKGGYIFLALDNDQD